ncbi:hypothetical protein RUM44_011318 [Polyplax serrata]|uniref:Uncharacterized protein n=1 Tax=Polyplax serrata TaxID=468196 RepID=A0ABR1APR7_POLSC
MCPTHTRGTRRQTEAYGLTERDGMTGVALQCRTQVKNMFKRKIKGTVVNWKVQDVSLEKTDQWVDQREIYVKVEEEEEEEEKFCRLTQIRVPFLILKPDIILRASDIFSAYENAFV